MQVEYNVSSTVFIAERRKMKQCRLKYAFEIDLFIYLFIFHEPCMFFFKKKT